MRISVLYVIDTLEVGGTERSLLEIVTRLENIDVTVCHIYPGNALGSEYERRGVRVVSLGIRGKYAPVRTVAALRRLIADLEPDIVHSMLFRASLFSRLATVGSRSTLAESLVKDSYGERRSRELRGIALGKHQLLRALDRATAGRVAAFLANSATIARSNAAALRIPESRLRVVYRGRSASDYEVRDGAAARIRADLEVGVAPLVLNVARLRDMKGQAELVRAAAQVVREVPGARVVIAGEGPLRGNLEALIERLELQSTVRLLGYRSDVPELLAAADVFAFPSHYEGHPGALVEAMFAGRPIVASDTPEHRETVEHERTARLVPVGDAEALAAAIVWMLKHPEAAAEMGERARRVAADKFGIEEVARRHEQTYRELVASRRRAG